MSKELSAKFDAILAQHEALRTTNRELSAENKKLKTAYRILRAKMAGTVLGRKPKEKK